MSAAPFAVSAPYIEWAHGPGAESGQRLAIELCDLPVRQGRRVLIPADRPDLVREVASVAELYVGGDDHDSRAARVLKSARAYLAVLSKVPA